MDLKLDLDASDDPLSSISWSTVSSFKGLENEYIFLVEGTNVKLNDWHRSLLYVALTRAKTEFHYFGREDDDLWVGIVNAKRRL